MITRSKNIFRYRYVFGLLFAVLIFLFTRNLILYIQKPDQYLAAFIPGLRPDYYLSRLTGVEFLIIDFTLLSLLLVFAFIALSFWYDKRTDKEKKLKSMTENLVIPIIIGHVYEDLLFISDVHKKDIADLKERLKNRKTLEVFFITIVHFQDLVDDDMSQRLNELCLLLDARKRISYFMQSVKDSDVILGLRVIRTLKAKDSLPYVNHYIQSKSPILRIEAILTRLSITEKTHPNELFSSHPYLSAMDINRLMPEFKKHVQTNENLELFLDAPSPRVNAFGVILLKEKKNLLYKGLIKKLLNKEDAFLRSVIWDYLSSVADDKDVWFLSVFYWNENSENKTKILSEMRRMQPSDIWISFLDRVIHNEDAPYKVLALEAIFNQDTERFIDYMDVKEKSIENAWDEVVNFVN